MLLQEWKYDLKERPKLVVNEDDLVYNKPEPIENVITWVYEEGSFVPSAKIVGEEKFSIINDYIGRPVQAYNELGELVWETEYDIYGGLRNLRGDRNFIPFRQLGQYEDVETGLYYNRFRYYNPDTGLYLSQDPIGLDGGKAFYGYVHDSNSWVDPFGLAECTLIFRHKTKPGKTTDLKELKRQIREQIKAMNKVIKAEGLQGLKDRVANYGPDLEKEGRAFTKSLGSAGEGKIWAHTPDMKTGGLPKDVSKIPGGSRENSILGGQAPLPHESFRVAQSKSVKNIKNATARILSCGMLLNIKHSKNYYIIN